MDRLVFSRLGSAALGGISCRERVGSCVTTFREFLLLPVVLVLLLQGCQVMSGKAQVVRVREVIGTIEVASSADDELKSTDTDRGLDIMSQGGFLRLPAEARVRLEFLHRKGYVYFYGPGELEVTQARLVKGSGGVHSKAEEVHATFHLRGGLIAGAMEGSLGDRPSIEIMTDHGSTQLESTGKFAVMQLGEDDWIEIWIRDERGPKDLRILLSDGKAVDFPPNGTFIFDQDEPAGEDAMSVVPFLFTRGFLEMLTVDPGPLPDKEQLIFAIRWKSLDNL